MMTINFPIYTIATLIATMAATGIATWFVAAQAFKSLRIAPRIRRNWVWGSAGVLFVWLVLRLTMAAIPYYPSGKPSVVSLTFIALGLLAGMLPLALSPTLRAALRSVPADHLVRVQAIRIAGFLFLALLDMGFLPAPFAVSAGYGDMAVGLSALGVAYLLKRRHPQARVLASIWNGLGLLDFAGALATGLLFIGPFAQGLAASGGARHVLDFVLVVPSFAVPLYAALHVYSLFGLWSKRAPVGVKSARTVSA